MVVAFLVGSYKCAVALILSEDLQVSCRREDLFWGAECDLKQSNQDLSMVLVAF